MTLRKSIYLGLIVLLVGIGIFSLFPRGAFAGDPTNTDTSAADKEDAALATNQNGLDKSQPIPPALTYSQERQNLIGRVGIEAQQGTVGYVALIGPQGQLVAYYTIQGKVTSLNSYLTTQDTVDCPGGLSDVGCVTVQAPDMDGSYGVNPDGIFFFTTSGTYVEWSGMYLYSNQPLSYSQAPLLVESQKK